MTVNFVDLFEDHVYDADTDDIDNRNNMVKNKRKPKIVYAVQSVNVPSENVYDEPSAEKQNVFDMSTVYDTSDDSNFDKLTQVRNSENVESDIVISEVEIFKNCDLTPNNIKDLQRKDSDFMPLIKYLEINELPASQKQARKLLLEASDYLLIDGILFHSSIKKSRRERNLDNYQIVVPRLMRNLVLQVCHDSPLGGHSGIKNTIDRVREHYYFPKLSTIVSDYVRSCHECQIRKTSSFHTKAGIVPFPTPSQPFEVWEVDLCGPFPLSSSGHSHIFTAIDMFSKLLFAVPLHTGVIVTLCLFVMHYFNFIPLMVCVTLLLAIRDQNLFQRELKNYVKC